jgi:hypothetical protein
MKQFRWLAAGLLAATFMLASAASAEVDMDYICGLNNPPANWDVKDDGPDGANSYTLYAPAGKIVEAICIKTGAGVSGDGIVGPITEDGTYEVDACTFTVSGMGTDSVSLTSAGEGCGLSNIQIWYGDLTLQNLTALKDAVATYDVDWELEKYVNAFGTKLAEYTGVAGDEFFPKWLLFVERVESDFHVKGEITISNPNMVPVDVTVTDELDDGTVATVTCPGGGNTGTVPAAGSLVCEYEAEPVDRAATRNTATITPITPGVAGTFAEADVNWPMKPDGILTDDRFTDFREVLDDSDDFELPETFVCSADVRRYLDGFYTETFTNTATLTVGEDAQHDSAQVKLNCTLPPLNVIKDAAGTFDRTVDWDLKKFVNEVDQKLAVYSGGPGDVFPTDWLLYVTKTAVEGNFSVTGDITITNPAAVTQSVTNVTDVLDDGTVATVDCFAEFPIEILAGGQLVCEYSASPAGKTATLNTATVSATGNDDRTATAPVSFTQNQATIESGTLSDDRFDGVINPLFEQTVSGNANFTLSEDFICPPADSDLYVDGVYSDVIVNTADLNDEINLQDSATVTIECRLRFKGETAWAANGDTPLEFRYTRRGNWATYVEYDGDKTTTLFAGQTIEVGSVEFEAFGDDVRITVTLGQFDGIEWVFDPYPTHNLMVQDYASAPSGNPEPGLFDHKTFCTENTCSIVVPLNDFYGVHVNVGYWW